MQPKTLYVRKILVVRCLYQKRLRGQTGALGKELRSNSSPGKLIALGIRDLVVSALLIHAFVEAQ